MVILYKSDEGFGWWPSPEPTAHELHERDVVQKIWDSDYMDHEASDRWTIARMLEPNRAPNEIKSHGTTYSVWGIQEASERWNADGSYTVTRTTSGPFGSITLTKTARTERANGHVCVTNTIKYSPSVFGAQPFSETSQKFYAE